MLNISNLRVSYGPIEVIHGIDLHVNEGECIALIGANGAGKSLTLKAICGLVPAIAGQITFEGSDVTNQSGHAIVKAGITMCPEGRQFSRK
jgi:branched-chain amino acid transport system ATP-binding protein